MDENAGAHCATSRAGVTGLHEQILNAVAPAPLSAFDAAKPAAATAPSSSAARGDTVVPPAYEAHAASPAPSSSTLNSTRPELEFVAMLSLSLGRDVLLADKDELLGLLDWWIKDCSRLEHGVVASLKDEVASLKDKLADSDATVASLKDVIIAEQERVKNPDVSNKPLVPREEARVAVTAGADDVITKLAAVFETSSEHAANLGNIEKAPLPTEKTSAGAPATTAPHGHQYAPAAWPPAPPAAWPRPTAAWNPQEAAMLLAVASNPNAVAALTVLNIWQQGPPGAVAAGYGHPPPLPQ